jgi:hypothetical protein
MIHLIAGLIVLVVGAWGVIAWWDEFGAVLRGFLPAWLVLVGLAAIAAGLQKTMNNAESKQGNWEESGADALAGPGED